MNITPNPGNVLRLRGLGQSVQADRELEHMSEETQSEIQGRVSWFGGPADRGMKRTEGLAYFEHIEADLRPDLFGPKNLADPEEGTSQRLRPDAYYLALPLTGVAREDVAGSCWRVTNVQTQQSVVCTLVDWGPNPKTGRVADVSPLTMRTLRLSTDDVVAVRRIS